MARLQKRNRAFEKGFGRPIITLSKCLSPLMKHEGTCKDCWVQKYLKIWEREPFQVSWSEKRKMVWRSDFHDEHEIKLSGKSHAHENVVVDTIGWIPDAFYEQAKQFLATTNSENTYGTLVHKQPKPLKWPPRVFTLLEENGSVQHRFCIRQKLHCGTSCLWGAESFQTLRCAGSQETIYQD